MWLTPRPFTPTTATPNFSFGLVLCFSAASVDSEPEDREPEDRELAATAEAVAHMDCSRNARRERFDMAIS
jgi:hypothetical protein